MWWTNPKDFSDDARCQNISNESLSIRAEGECRAIFQEIVWNFFTSGLVWKICRKTRPHCNIITDFEFVNLPFKNFLSNDVEKQKSFTGSSTQKWSKLRIKYFVTELESESFAEILGQMSPAKIIKQVKEIALYRQIAQSKNNKNLSQHWTTYLF